MSNPKAILSVPGDGPAWLIPYLDALMQQSRMKFDALYMASLLRRTQGLACTGSGS
jgi:hypothetical protein